MPTRKTFLRRGRPYIWRVAFGIHALLLLFNGSAMDEWHRPDGQCPLSSCVRLLHAARATRAIFTPRDSGNLVCLADCFIFLLTLQSRRSSSGLWHRLSEPVCIPGILPGRSVDPRPKWPGYTQVIDLCHDHDRSCPQTLPPSLATPASAPDHPLQTA